MRNAIRKQSDSYLLGYGSQVVNMLSKRSFVKEGAFLLPFLKPGMCILDVGCGPGTISISLAECFPYINVVGIDIEEQQIAQACDSVKRLGIENIEFYVADVYALPFEPETFDLIYAHTLFMHLASPERALQNFFHSVKPNGIIGIRDGISSFDNFTNLDLPDRFSSLSDLFRRAIEQGPAMVDVGIKLKGLLRSSGFENIKISSFNKIYDHPEEIEILKSWYQSMFSTTLGQSILKYGLLSSKELDTLIEGLSAWPEDPAALSILCWIEYIAQKKEIPKI